MLKKMALIVNPVAGRGQYLPELSGVVEVFCQNDYSVTVFMTAKKGDAAAFARRYGREYKTLVCCGGDGTLSEAISGLMELKRPPVLGYIPVGTTNDFAASLGLSKSLPRAARQIAAAQPVALDIGAFGRDYFTYIAAFGAFTDVSYTTPQETKNALGQLAYLLEGISRLGDIPAYHAVVEHSRGVFDGTFIFGGVTNSMSVAGVVKLSPDTVSLTDGLFEVFLIRPPRKISHYQRIITSILTQNYDSDYVEFFHTARIIFRFDQPVPWTIDGEDGGEHTHITIQNLPRRMRMLV